MLLFLGLCLVLMVVTPLSESAPAPVPAPLTPELLIGAQLVTLAGLKGVLIGQILSGE